MVVAVGCARISVLVRLVAARVGEVGGAESGGPHAVEVVLIPLAKSLRVVVGHWWRSSARGERGLCWGPTVLRPVGVGEVPEDTASLAWRVHPRGTDEMRVRDALGPLFTDEDFMSGEFEGMYSSLGQPGLSPAFLLVVTILQFRHNLADREAAQAVADRISWKYALGLGLDYAGFDSTYALLCVGRRLSRGNG
ncbi:transposase [Streptomyces sp. NPDC059373]